VEDLQKAKASLEAETAEQRRELEVSENDKTVLRDALKQVEEEKNGLALDLAETSKVGQQITKWLVVDSASVFWIRIWNRNFWIRKNYSGSEQLRIRIEFEVKKL
jgi:hypothetical protein